MTPPHGWQYPPPPPPPPTPRLGLGARIALIIGGVLLVGAITGIDRSDRAAATASIAARPTPTPARAAPVMSEASPSVGIGDGTWLIGTDMQQGTYRSTGAQHGFFEFCMWSTHEGASSNSDIIDFGTANADEPMVVTIDKHVRAFVTSNCEPWVKIG